MADFETTTVMDDCRVWAWGLVGVPDDWQSLDLHSVQVGQTLDDFIVEISGTNTICYFHNLRFDGKFIIDWLLKNGYTHRTGQGNITEGQFRTLISDMGAFYSITVRWVGGHHTEFRDSAKKLPMTVKRIAESFRMEHTKGDIDYHKTRPVGYIPDDIECDYIRRDCLIVARAVGQQIKQGMHKLTIGSDALYEFKKSIGGQRSFDKLFPCFSLEMDSEIRRAYRGGFTYSDSRFRGTQVGPGMVFDVNSLYPSVMYYEQIPFGEPEYFTGRPEPTRTHPLTIFEVTFEAHIKPDHIPCIQVKNNLAFVETEYLQHLNEPTTLMLTNVDWQLIQDHYDVTVIAWGGGWRFKAAVGIFNDYIDKYMKIKANSIGGIREIAKLFLNALYGKFATRPEVTGRVPYLDDTQTVRFKQGPYETRNPVYTPAGVFITSHARNVTIRAAQKNYNAFAYADTDSLHLVGITDPVGIRVHKTDLGAWKHEYDFQAAHYIRAKAYFEQGMDGTYHNAIAGVPTDISAALTFADLTPGTEITVVDNQIIRRTHRGESVLIHGKKNPKTVPGGVVLSDVPYELKLA